MKIMTANVPETYIEAMAKLIGDGGLYASRSELVRKAVGAFLVREYKHLKNLKNLKILNPEPEVFDDKTMIRIPIKDENEKVVEKYNTYKILRVLK